MSWAMVAVAGASLIGGLAAGSASKKAGSQQAQAVQQQYQQTRQDLLPWMQSGQLALGDLNTLLGLGSGGMPTRSQFTTTIPGTQGGVWRESGNATGTQGSWVPGQVVPARTSFDQAGFDAATAEAAARRGDPRFGSLLRPFDLEQFQESPAYQFNLEQGLDAINKGAASRGRFYAPATLQDIGKFSQGLASNEFLNAYNMYNQDQSNVYNRLFGMSASGQNAATQVGQFGAGAASEVGNARAAGTIGQSNAILGGVGDAYNNYLMYQILRGGQAPTYGAPAGGYSSQG